MDPVHSQNHGPDLRMIVDRKQATVPDSMCPICHRPESDEMRHAIETGLVLVCHRCYCPRLRTDYGFGMQFEEIRSCHCHCTCPELPLNSDGLPDLLPFVPNNKSATPKPWVQEWLANNGFRNINRQSATIRRQLASGQYLPTRHSIIDGSYQLATSELAALPLIDYETARYENFPNQVERSAATESGLPVQLEAMIRRLDPDAFGHVTRAWYEREMFRNYENLEFVSEAQVLAYCKLQQLLGDRGRSTRNDPACQFHIWAIEHGDLADDADSVCTADELGIHRCDYEERLLDHEDDWNHQVRHAKRQLNQIATRGGYLTTDAVLHEAANAEVTFRADWENGELYPMEYDELERSDSASEVSGVFDDDDFDYDYDNAIVSFLESIGQDLQFRFDFEWL